MDAIVKLRKKGIIILPKKIRNAAGIKEGEDLIVKVRENKIIIEKLEPLIVDIDPRKVEEILEEEKQLEGKRIERILGE
ncbi:MAG: AbrB/MazE/SpoVT family DNA-binding domain-containing protein [Candidatus Njordarchaeia archaeon]